MPRRRFQFRMRTLFVVVTLFCIAAGLVRVAAANLTELGLLNLLAWPAIAATGFAVGSAFRRPFLGMFLTLLGFVILGFIVGLGWSSVD